MDIVEILIIILIVAFVIFIFGREIYKKVTNKPTGECACCNMKSKRTLNEMRKAIRDSKNRTC